MDIQRTLLIAAIAVLSFMLVVEWAAFRQQEPAAISAQADSTQTPARAAAQSSGEDIPEVSSTATEQDAELISSHGSDTVSVSTDVLELTIDLSGGDIIYAALPKHHAEIDTPDQPFVILEQNRQREYIAQSGLIGKNGTDTRDGRPTFVTENASYQLSDGQDELTVTLAYGQSRDITIYKHYRFKRGSYLVEMDYEIDNRSDEQWQGVLFTQLKRDNSEDPATQDSGTEPSDTQTAAATTEETTADGTAPGAKESDGSAPITPSFDVVRVEPTGDTVLAGRAAPNSKVTVLDNGRPLGTVTADEKGEWVFLPDRPLEPGSRELSLESEDAAGTKLLSEDVVVMSVPDTRTADGDGASGESAQSQEEAIAVLTPRDGGAVEGGSQILQAPKGEGISEGDLVLEAVDYGQDGGITVSGRGKPGTTVRLYLDNEAIGEVQPDAEGRWSYRVARELPFGVYQLRADQVNQDGEVMARVETPFSRVEFARADLPDEKFVIVQPGNSLWRIARGTLGQGVQYTVIYEANADQIRDPDLIYPGQIFMVPQTN